MTLGVRDFNDYVLSLSPAVYFPFGLGDVVRRDGNSSVKPTVNGTPKWEHRRGLYLLRPDSGGSLELDQGDIGETNVDEFTIMLAGDFLSPEDLGDAYTIADKSARWQIRMYSNGGVDTFRFIDSAPANHNIPFDVDGARTMTITGEDGGDVTLFKNGTLVNDSGGVDLSTTAADMFILNNDTNNDEMRGALSLFLFIPEILNGEQIADLSRTWEALL